MNITVIGTGYVGLVTGTCFAEQGFDVTCVDIDQAKVNLLQSGSMPIYEPELETIFSRNISDGRLHFTTTLDSVGNSDVIFLALPTPQDSDGSADLSYVLGVADKLGPLLKDYTVIVDKSTVPVGTSEKVREKIARNCNADFDVVSNPEFLREGRAVEDFQKPDRVIIGTSSDKAKEVMIKLYKDFVTQDCPLLFMDERSAELTKYAANSFLATKISFMNQLANLAEILGANIDSIRLGIGYDPRIGNQFLYSGIGYGGSCFPKDVIAIQKTSGDHGYELNIIKAVSDVNDEQKLRLVKKVVDYYKGDINGKTFAIWGLAFKPETDDIREAPAVEIIKGLLSKGAKVIAFDPEAADNVKKYWPDLDVTYSNDMYEAIDGSDALLVVTEWADFRNADIEKIKSLLKAPVIFDGRNIYSIEQMKAHGFHYESIGRPTIINEVKNV